MALGGQQSSSRALNPFRGKMAATLAYRVSSVCMPLCRGAMWVWHRSNVWHASGHQPTSFPFKHQTSFSSQYDCRTPHCGLVGQFQLLCLWHRWNEPYLTVLCRRFPPRCRKWIVGRPFLMAVYKTSFYHWYTPLTLLTLSVSIHRSGVLRRSVKIILYKFPSIWLRWKYCHFSMYGKGDRRFWLVGGWDGWLKD